MLGRQGFEIQGRFRRRYEATLRAYGYDTPIDDFLQGDGYSETMMQRLGFGEIETMDFSAYEGANVIHDLNKLPAKKLQGKFDFIFDGGTIEHVFNVPNALESIFRMLKPGGRFVSANGFNGWHNHGMYQFTPELVWTFWRRACNCNVIDCRALPALPTTKYPALAFSDPAETGHRLKLRGKIGPGRTYLYYEVEKTSDSHLPDFALQSDYETKWQGHENAGQTRLEA